MSRLRPQRPACCFHHAVSVPLRAVARLMAALFFEFLRPRLRLIHASFDAGAA